MNYYPYHIGDFNNATRHLTRIERSVYRDLMDLYYDTESELTLDFNALCRLIIARSDEERTAVEQVLNEFFTQTEQGWFHSRCDEEIQKYQANIAAKSAAGKASAARRAQKTAKKTINSDSGVQDQNNKSSTGVEQPLNECATNQNQNQNQNIKDISSGKPDLPDGFVEFWSEWPSTARKVAKSKCLEKWRRMSLERVAGEIVSHIRHQKANNRQWLDGFEPSPLTYLNQRRWDDDSDLPDGGVNEWWEKAGFSSRFDAENAGCNQFIYQQFQNGKRMEAHA